MKNTYIIITVVLVAAVLAFFFGSNESNAPVVVEEEGGALFNESNYSVDTSASSIKWTIEYSTGASEEGTVDLSSGSLVVAEGEPFAGEFLVDMASLHPDSNLVLENFLKAESVLDVDTYPTAKFVISKVLPNPVSGTSTGKYILDGKLTVKRKENPISFPVTFSKENGNLVAISTFALNKSEWGIDNKEIKNAVIVELNIRLSPKQ